MIKLLNLLKENNKILIPRRSAEERKKNHAIALKKKIQQYIKDGSKGDLNLSDTPITSLPQGLKVGGDLDLSYTPITSLPQGLTIGGDLNLSYTPITSLPQGLTVGGDLYLKKTQITSLPQDLKVGDNLDLSNTPISKKYTKEQIKQMVPGVEGNIYT
jgi:hypothetical protein